MTKSQIAHLKYGQMSFEVLFQERTNRKRRKTICNFRDLDIVYCIKMLWICSKNLIMYNPDYFKYSFTCLGTSTRRQ